MKRKEITTIKDFDGPLDKVIDRLIEIYDNSKNNFANINIQLGTRWDSYGDPYGVVVIDGNEILPPRKLTVAEIINSDKRCFYMD
jgi:hypothetical protein